MATKPTLPSTYVLPKVWSPSQTEEAFKGMNRPTAGARDDRKLPVGKHDLQLYSLGTPNGIKVTVLLEELGVDYDAFYIDIMKLDQFGSDFVKVNPNSKIPALLDRSFDPPVRVFESVSILLYLAEKYGKFIPKDIHAKTEMMNWVIWNVGTAPFIGGGFGHFYHYAPIHIEYAIDRYTMETKRIIDVLDKHLEGKKFILGDEYSLADIANYSWFRALKVAYGNAREFLDFDSYKNVNRWLETIGERPAVKRGTRVNGFGPDAVKERHSKEDFN